METKVCCTCRKEKLVGDFYKASNSKDGLQGACVDCTHRNNVERAQKSICRNGYRKCADCNHKKHVSQFPTNKFTDGKLSRRCSDCEEIYQSDRLMLEYGLKMSDYLRMVEDQDNRCAICDYLEDMDDMRGNRMNLKIHKEFEGGKVHQLLCRQCHETIQGIECSIINGNYAETIDYSDKLYKS